MRKHRTTTDKAGRAVQTWFTFFTRKWRFADYQDALRALAREPNITLMCSYDPTMVKFGTPDEALRGAPIGVSYVEFDLASLREFGAVCCPKTAGEVESGDEDDRAVHQSCDRCQYCYGTPARTFKTPRVFYASHGGGYTRQEVCESFQKGLLLGFPASVRAAPRRDMLTNCNKQPKRRAR